MSERSQLQITTWIAVAALVISLLSHFYTYHQAHDALNRVALLERRNAILDSIQHNRISKADSVRQQQVYQTAIASYEKAANLAFAQNQNLPNSGKQSLLVKNDCSVPLRFAIAFRGLNKTWFSEGMLPLASKESMRIWAVDSAASVYVYTESDVLINEERLRDLTPVNLSVDTANSFIFTGNTPPPHTTAFRVVYHEVNPTMDSKIVFSDP
jgi:hypothetical protein